MMPCLMELISDYEEDNDEVMNDSLTLLFEVDNLLERLASSFGIVSIFVLSLFISYLLFIVGDDNFSLTKKIDVLIAGRMAGQSKLS